MPLEGGEALLWLGGHDCLGGATEGGGEHAGLKWEGSVVVSNLDDPRRKSEVFLSKV